MHRLPTFLLSIPLTLLPMGLIGTTAPAALAQADAQAAFQQAKAAFQAGKFAEARDLAKKASETDAKNPEVFLLLGKAHYQLGELDEALVAWQRTLALAPEEPFAAKMLEVLRGQRAGADLRIKLVEAMIVEKLFAPAQQEYRRLLGDKSLSEAQRAKVITLQAETLVHTNQPAEAQRVLSELLLVYPKLADPAQTMLLLGQAKLRAGGDATAEGVTLLRKVAEMVAADHVGAPVAATAQYELIAFELKQGVDAARTDALAKWLADHPKHPLVAEAQRALVDACLTLARQGAKPSRQSALTAADAKALALAVEIAKQQVRTEVTAGLVDTLLKHLESHYAANQAHAAAVQGVQTLLAAPLPKPSRLAGLKALAQYKQRAAMEWLNEEARAGRLDAVPVTKAGFLRVHPSVIAGVLSVYQTIRTEFPAEPLWAEQAALAVQVRALNARVVWRPDEVKGFRRPDAWAMAIALPVVRANADPAAVKTAVDVFQGVIQDCSAVGQQPGARGLALWASGELLNASLSLTDNKGLIPAPLSPDHPAWPGMMMGHVALLDGEAKYQFQENIKSGNGAQNAKLSNTQKLLLDTLAKLVAIDAQQSAAAMKAASDHLAPWIDGGHWAVAEEVYATLAKALPQSDRRQAELAVVDLWIQQVLREHQRLVAAGLSVPRELDPTLKKALLRCYELQAGLDPASPKLAQIRGVSDRVIAYYTALEYYDVAEAAVKVKAEAAVDAADQYAAFQLIHLQEDQARRELARSLRQYGAPDKISLTPGFQAVLAAWTKFITDRPAGPLVPQAAEQIFGVARLFEQHGACTVAAGVYGDMAKFAAKVKVLSQSSPATASSAQRAAFAAAGAWDSQARKTLAKATADRKSGDLPPGKLSDEFAVAIASYKGFIAAYPDSILVRDAIGKVMAVALEYARIDAWDVADGVYADLLKSNLKIRRPERLEFARGLCQLGHAMPEHAREVLTALSAAGLRGAEGPSEIALAARGGEVGGRMMPGGGGFGGAGGAVGMADYGMPGGAPGYAAAGMPPGVASGPMDGTKLAAGSASSTARPATSALSAETDEAKRDVQLLAMIRQRESSRSAKVAQLRERLDLSMNQPAAQGQRAAQQPQADQQAKLPAAVPVLSEAELARQEKAIDAAYAIFQGIRKSYAETPTAEQARAEILVMVSHWRGLTQWHRSAALAGRFLTDNPTDGQLPQLRLEIARDRLAYASKPLEKPMAKQAMLTEVSGRFSAARAELAKIVTEFPAEKTLQQDAQWDIANSFLTEARAIAVLSPTLARGQFIRATRELQKVADKHPTHPRIGAIPQMLWGISQELEGRGYDEEAILVWNELVIHDPTNPLAQTSALKIAQTYHQKLKRPLKAAETYQELNFARGGSDQAAQDAIFRIGSELKDQKRWVEALHVLEAFVDSFPRHPQAGQALATAGQIHQANEAWKDAIAAYRRVIAEFGEGHDHPADGARQDAKWSIAECTINLSQWSEAMAAYRDFVAAYPKDAKVAEANRRIEVLKDLARYQGLVDEKGQRKAFDAQYQIAVIVRNQLSNPVKAIIEYRKVVTNWPESYVAAPALHEMGTAYLSLGETEKARDALKQVAEKYPTSPLASSALFMVGKSYEDEADKLASVTREKSLEQARDVAQRNAYELSQSSRRQQLDSRAGRVADLKKEGKSKAAEVEEASGAALYGVFNDANVKVFAQKAIQDVETLTATQLADRQDKINAALRKAVAAYTATSKIAGGNKADAALLQMATIYDQRLKDSKAAMETWLEIVRQFSGTAVAEDASWKLAQYYEREGKYSEAIDAYTAFLRNYRRSPNAGPAQFAIAENYERIGKWVAAMDSYNNYITNFPEGPLVNKAKEQINWIKTYRL